jgi:transmembrane sensor
VPVVAGQNMVLDDSIEVSNDKIELVQEMEPKQIEKRLSWRDGILMFDNDTLEEVIAEINRYSSAMIVISDPEIRDLRFGGYFQASDVNTILTTLEENYGITVERLNPGVINLSRLTDQH